MGKIEDILHAFLDGETTDAQEIALIHALLARPQLREHFVKACRIHHATLSAHSKDQAAEFKNRLDLFCRRWEATSQTCQSDLKSAFGAGALTSGIAAAFLLGLGFFAFQFSRSDSDGLGEAGPLVVNDIVSPVRHVTLVSPSTDLDGEPLSITFSVAQVTSEEMKEMETRQNALSGPYPELSDTFSQAYIKLLRDEREQVSGTLGSGTESFESGFNDPFQFELSDFGSEQQPFGSNEPVTFTFETVSE
ncbi:MAG: hypothetical protein ACPGN3_16055 [Opitutales bacterium]